MFSVLSLLSHKSHIGWAFVQTLEGKRSCNIIASEIILHLMPKQFHQLSWHHTNYCLTSWLSYQLMFVCMGEVVAMSRGTFLLSEMFLFCLLCLTVPLLCVLLYTFIVKCLQTNSPLWDSKVWIPNRIVAFDPQSIFWETLMGSRTEEINYIATPPVCLNRFYLSCDCCQSSRRQSCSMSSPY